MGFVFLNQALYATSLKRSRISLLKCCQNLSMSNKVHSSNSIENKKPVNPGFMQNLQLNDKYTFDNFVQGEGNKLAAGAALEFL